MALADPGQQTRTSRRRGNGPGYGERGEHGYDDGDIPDLVDGTMKQQRRLAIAPTDVTEDDIAGIFRRSLHLW